MPHFVKLNSDLIKNASDELISINRLNKGLKFNGTSHNITFGAISDMQFQRADNFSLSAWVYIPPTLVGSGTIYIPIFSYLDSVNNNVAGYAFYISYLSSTGLYTLVFQHQTSGSIYMYAQCAITPGLKHIVFTKNGTTPSSNFKLYIDKEPATLTGSGSTWTSGTLTYTANFNAFIGTRIINVAAVNYTQAYVFDFKSYNKALSQAEVTDDFETDGLKYPRADSLHVWDFNENSGLVLTDRKGSSNGTLQYSVPETTLGVGNFHINAIDFQPVV